ncbi:MAG: hypothetical protein ABL921_25800, partial [Pirellula sp.]
NQPAPNQPAPNQPAPNQPAPNQPAPNQPAPNQPTPNQSTPYLANNNPQLMVGQAYPPLPKEYQPVVSPNSVPLAIPAYEQNAIDNQQAGGGYTGTQQAIRQPNATGSNRYQGVMIQQPATSTAKTPYTPIYPPQIPAQSGNSIGYPPK